MHGRPHILSLFNISFSKLNKHEHSCKIFYIKYTSLFQEAQWLNGRVLDSLPRGQMFEPHQRHPVGGGGGGVTALWPSARDIHPSLVLVNTGRPVPTYLNDC